MKVIFGNQCEAQMKFDLFGSVGNAECTSRLLSGSADHWAAEEWSENVKAGKITGTRYYLFDAETVAAAAERNPHNPAEEYPWDEDHCSKLVIDDDMLD